jgi:hypothetical protein
MVAGSMAGGMWVLWSRLTRQESAWAPTLVATAVLLTPFVVIPISLGQNAALMFLSACLGTEQGTRNSRALVIATVLAATVMFKLSPLLLVAVLVWQGRWKIAGFALAILIALTALTAALLPHSLFSAFWETGLAIREDALANPYNGALDSVLAVWWRPFVESSGGSIGLLVLRVVLAGVAFWFVAKRTGRDSQWAYAWVLLMLALPMVWWHYLLISIPALAFAVAERGLVRRHGRLIVPVAAAITIPISFMYVSGVRMPWAQALYLLGVIVAVPVIVRSLPARPFRPAWS